ncbi:MAG TPA: GWxTD domain-containing protein [Gemmatimonadaceae bacterium]|nr:GWxTD domain-containing protein [Gemmatimonadaceae bacterium]
MSPRPASRLIPLALALLAVAGSAACGSRPVSNGGGPSPERARGRGRFRPLDPIPLYTDAGLIAQAEPVRFIGSVRYLAGPTPDTTLLLVNLSLANNALSFVPQGDAQVARYLVAMELKHGGTTARRVDSRESVRVGSYRETSRSDESVLFQQFIGAAPGQYDLTVAVRDEGSGRSAQQTVTVLVPRLAPAALSTPVTVYEATARATTDTVPDLIANPRSTVFFGRDSLVHVYLEGYGFPAGTEAELSVHGDRDAILWSDSVPVGGPGRLHAAVASIPVSVLGVGKMSLVASAPGTEMRAPLFVTFGDEWAITSLNEMLGYLRYFASAARLQQLRDANPDERAAAWVAFYRETDPDPRTPEHEALRDYFGRIQFANERFNEEGTPGWLTDRGKVFITLGDPDQVLEQGESAMNVRGRTQVWTYSQYRLQVVFVDQSGFGRWRLTPSSENAFNMVAIRERK